jgi:hypothetical protein
MFYVDFFSTATGGDYDTLVNRVNQQNGHFNSIEGAAFVELGTATIDSATGNVTAWAPSNVDVKRDAAAYAAIQQSIADNVAQINQTASAQHTLLTQKINAWATFLQKRTSSVSRFLLIPFTVPSFTIPAGQRVACSFPAIIGTTFRATGTNARIETRPSWVNFTQTYTTLSDGTKVPLNVDDNTVRYVALGVSGIVFNNAKYNNQGKNASRCVVGSFNIAGSDYDRRIYIYPQNIGTAEAIIDIACTVLFVRRG